jgi:protein-S-isoprenylcysteine O-methyltransferase Ste14
MSSLPSLGRRGEGWVALQVLLVAAIALAGVFAGGAWSGAARLVSVVGGVALVVAGGLLATQAVRDLGAALTPFPRPRPGSELVSTGAYRFVRHPIYGGLVIASFGWALICASVVALLLSLVLLAFFDLKSRREEAWLVAHDPLYRARLPGRRRLIPWLY